MPQRAATAAVVARAQEVVPHAAEAFGAQPARERGSGTGEQAVELTARDPVPAGGRWAARPAITPACGPSSVRECPRPSRHSRRRRSFTRVRTALVVTLIQLGTDIPKAAETRARVSWRRRCRCRCTSATSAWRCGGRSHSTARALSVAHPDPTPPRHRSVATLKRSLTRNSFAIAELGSPEANRSAAVMRIPSRNCRRSSDSPPPCAYLMTTTYREDQGMCVSSRTRPPTGRSSLPERGGQQGTFEDVPVKNQTKPLSQHQRKRRHAQCVWTCPGQLSTDQVCKNEGTFTVDFRRTVWFKKFDPSAVLHALE